MTDIAFIIVCITGTCIFAFLAFATMADAGFIERQTVVGTVSSLVWLAMLVGLRWVTSESGTARSTIHAIAFLGARPVHELAAMGLLWIVIMMTLVEAGTKSAWLLDALRDERNR